MILSQPRPRSAPPQSAHWAGGMSDFSNGTKLSELLIDYVKAGARLHDEASIFIIGFGGKLVDASSIALVAQNCGQCLAKQCP